MKSCRKRGAAFTPPCKCQMLCNLRAFRQAHEEKCNTVDPREFSMRQKTFCTDSEYEGNWRKGFGMQGYGVYTFPNGVIYEGEFNDGTMHGKGELRYKISSGTAAIKGEWKNGTMVEKTITQTGVIFDDVLEYNEHDWKYCKMPDRRFSIEYQKGLLPAGKSLLTAPQPTIKVPVGYYDTDDGFYDIKRKVVYEHDDLTKIVRGPSSRERKWIHDNCRLGAERLNFGPRPDLYEQFVEPTMLLEPDQPSEYYTRFKLNSELSDMMEPETATDYDVKENILAAVPSELLLT